MAPTHRDPVDQNAHGSPGQQRYRSSSFSSDIPIPSSPSLYGVNGFEYRAPYATEQSPSNRPSMSHSASLPTVLMAPDEDPFGGSSSRRSSMSSTQGDVSTPKKQKSTYNHPYLIHSSSSAVLSRTNTSPSVSYTALPPSTPGHRASKSMGFLRSSQSVDDLRSPEKGETSRPLTQKERIQDGASGYTASYTPPVRRKLVNRYSVSSLSDLTQREEGGLENEQPRVKATGKLDMSVWAWKTGVQTETTMTGDLLPNPKAWNAHETAQYVAHCLSKGINPNPNSATVIMKLPPPVIQDITGWIKRGRITGKAFLAGGDSSWSSSAKPPPFLDVLLSLSRNLRRASLKGSIAGINWSPDKHEPKEGRHVSGAHGKDTSVLEEAENEDECSETDDEVVAGKVKRLAHDFDTRSTGSMSTAGSEVGEEDLTDRRRSRSSRAFSSSSRLSQGRGTVDVQDAVEQAKKFERGLDTINKQSAESVGAKFGRLVDTVRSESYSPAWDHAVAQGGIKPIKTEGQHMQNTHTVSRTGGDEEGVSNRKDAQPVGLGIFDSSHPHLKDHAIVEIDTISPASSFTSPPPAYTSPQFPNQEGTIPANHCDIVAISKNPTTMLEGQSVIGHQAEQNPSGDPVNMPFTRTSARPGPYGQLQNTLGGESTHQPRLPTAALLSKVTSESKHRVEDHSGNNSEADDEDARDTTRRVTIRPGRRVSTKTIPATPARLASPARSASVTPVRNPQTQPLAPDLSREMEGLKADLAAAQARILELEQTLRRRPLTDVPVGAAKQSGHLSNYQSLAMLYGGLTGLCVSILTIKVIGRKGLLG